MLPPAGSGDDPALANPYASGLPDEKQQQPKPAYQAVVEVLTRAPQRAALAAQSGVPIPQQLVFTPYHASGIYDVGETVGWTVTPRTDAADLRLQVDDPPQQRGGAQRRHAGSVRRQGHDRDCRRPARDDLRRGRSLRGSDALRPRRPPLAAPRFVGGNTGRNTGLLRGRRGGRAREDRPVDAASGRLRRVLGRQARRAGEASRSTRC